MKLSIELVIPLVGTCKIQQLFSTNQTVPTVVPATLREKLKSVPEIMIPEVALAVDQCIDCPIPALATKWVPGCVQIQSVNTPLWVALQHKLDENKMSLMQMSNVPIIQVSGDLKRVSLG